MVPTSVTPPAWLSAWMEAREIGLWGTADLRPFKTPVDATGKGFPYALSWAVPMNPATMARIKGGPNQAYAEEYARENRKINEVPTKLASEINARCFRSESLAASDRTDSENIKGDFPHNTATTRAGLCWIGCHCQLFTRPFGPWVRLGTVFTDMDLTCRPPKERSHYGIKTFKKNP